MTFLAVVIFFLIEWFVTLCYTNSFASWVFSEVHRDYERDTGCSNYYCMFPDCDGFLRFLEECCKVHYP